VGRALRRILDKIYHGSAELVLARLVSDTRPSEAQLLRMRRLLEEIEGDPEPAPRGAHRESREEEDA
jgi:hypothetical protein